MCQGNRFPQMYSDTIGKQVLFSIAVHHKNGQVHATKTCVSPLVYHRTQSKNRNESAFASRVGVAVIRLLLLRGWRVAAFSRCLLESPVGI